MFLLCRSLDILIENIIYLHDIIMHANTTEIFQGKFEAKAIRARIPLVCFISPLFEDNRSQQRHTFTWARPFVTFIGGW